MSTATPPTITDRASNWGPIIVSVVVLGIFLAAVVIAWWTKDDGLKWLLAGAATNATTAVGYWLGSSSGSKGKDATIAQMGAATIVPPVAGPTP